MAVEIKIPIPDQTTEVVRIVSWRKAVGDTVKKGEVILEIETDKAVMEVESAGDGFVLQQFSRVDDIVAIGKVVGFIGDAGEELPDRDRVVASEQPEAAIVGTKTVELKNFLATPLAVKVAAKRGVDVTAVSGSGARGKVMRKDIEQAACSSVSTATVERTGRLFASPNAKRLAKELAIDINTVAGSGPNGRVVGKDITESAKGKPAMSYMPASGMPVPAPGQPIPGSEEKLTRMRRAIADNTQRAARDIPHFNVSMSIDMSNALKFRSEHNKDKKRRDHISVNDLIVKGCAVALRRYPAVNSKFLDETIRYEAEVNIGVVAVLPAGLVIPVVTGVDKLNWESLGAETKAVIKSAKKGKLIGAGKGTFTVSSLAMFGIDEFTAIVNAPQAAILAVGGVNDKAVAIDGQVVVRPMMKVTLCSDHRVIDGALSAKFLVAFKRYLEDDIA